MYVCMYVCMYLCIYACLYVCMYLYMHVCCVYVWLSNVRASTHMNGCQSCIREAKWGRHYVSFPRLNRRIKYYGTGSAVLPRVSPLILYTLAESVTYSRFPRPLPVLRDGLHYYRQPSRRKSRVYGLTHDRTDDIHRQESVGTGPVVLK